MSHPVKILSSTHRTVENNWICDKNTAGTLTQTSIQARMKDRDRESKMERDDGSTVFLDGLRLKAPVRPQHHDVCRAHASRDNRNDN